MKNINYIVVIAFFILMTIGAHLIEQADFNGLYFICGGIFYLWRDSVFSPRKI